MLRFYCNHLRALIPTPSWFFMPPKSPCTEIPIQNANISTLDPHNFFSAGFCCTKFWESLFLPDSNLELKRWALYYLRNSGQKSCSPLTLTLFPQARRMIFLFPQAWRMIASSQRLLPSLFGSYWYLHMGYTTLMSGIFVISLIQSCLLFSWSALCSSVWYLLRFLACEDN